MPSLMGDGQFWSGCSRMPSVGYSGLAPYQSLRAHIGEIQLRVPRPDIIQAAVPKLDPEIEKAHAAVANDMSHIKLVSDNHDNFIQHLVPLSCQGSRRQGEVEVARRRPQLPKVREKGRRQAPEGGDEFCSLWCRARVGGGKLSPRRDQEDVWRASDRAGSMIQDGQVHMRQQSHLR